MLRRLRRHGLEQPELRPAGDKRHDLEERPRVRPQRCDAREDGIADRLGQNV
jgi:hypothetical protein